MANMWEVIMWDIFNKKKQEIFRCERTRYTLLVKCKWIQGVGPLNVLTQGSWQHSWTCNRFEQHFNTSTWCIGGGFPTTQVKLLRPVVCGVFHDIIKIFCYQYWSIVSVGLHPTFISRSTVVCRSATLFSCFRCTAARISSIFFRSCEHETAAVRGAHRLQPWRGAFITLHRGSLWGDM